MRATASAPSWRRTDLVCVLGGDGTFLRTARAIGGSGVPALGINLGRVGFLAKVETRRPGAARSTRSQAGDYAIEERFRIAARMVRADGSSEDHACLNEVVVARGTRVRMIQLEVEVSGSHLATYVADAVVVATPDRLDRLQLQRRRLDPRPAPAQHGHHAGRRLPVAAAQRGGRRGPRGAPHPARGATTARSISLDGQEDVPMAVGDRVEVRALPEPLRMIEPTGATPFYDLLRTKASLLPY